MHWGASYQKSHSNSDRSKMSPIRTPNLDEYLSVESYSELEQTISKRIYEIVERQSNEIAVKAKGQDPSILKNYFLLPFRIGKKEDNIQIRINPYVQRRMILKKVLTKAQCIQVKYFKVYFSKITQDTLIGTLEYYNCPNKVVISVRQTI